MKKAVKYPSFHLKKQSNYLAFQALIEKKEIIINDFDKEKNEGSLPYKFTSSSEPQTLVYIPLIVQEVAIGVLVVFSGKKFAYDEFDINVIRSIAASTAISLDNSNAYLKVDLERKKSDSLLLNILPEEVADELKVSGSAQPKHFEQVSVLFTDFKGFTNISEKMRPEELIEELNRCFFAFDEICEQYNLEKIKTIGDAYMAAAGLPVPNSTNPIDAVNAALAMQQWMENWKHEKQSQGKEFWEVRLGIHTGPVVAGVIGKNKFAYDIWGDTVNTASRMESSGEPGRVNISGSTYELIKNHFPTEYRGRIPAKNKGEIDMFFVNR